MAILRDGFCKTPLRFVSVRARVYIGVRRNGSDGEEERTLGGNGIIQKAQSLLCDYFRCVTVLVADRWFVVALICRVEVAVRVGIQQEIGPGETRDMRAIVVVHCVGVEELASIIGIVARFLEPDGEEVGVKSTLHELGVATCPHHRQPSACLSLVHTVNGWEGEQTVWRTDVGDVRVVCLSACP